MRVLVTTNGLKGCMSANSVANVVEIGFRRYAPKTSIIKLPAIDGGEGFAKDVVECLGGRLVSATASDPLRRKISVTFGIAQIEGQRTVVFESASTAGFSLLRETELNPMVTTTYGIGEVIVASLSQSPMKVLIGCGDSATNDAGIGMAQAIGVQFYDERGSRIGLGGKELIRIRTIDVSGVDPRIARTNFVAMCNQKSILTGPQGTSMRYAMRKGATQEQAEYLEQGMDNYVEIVKRQLKKDIGSFPGSGGSGGLGSALSLYLGAELKDNFYILEHMAVEDELANSDLVIISEGRMDHTTFRGKVNQKLIELAKKHNVPVLAIVGDVDGEEQKYLDRGVSGFLRLNEEGFSLEDAIKSAEQRIYAAIQRMVGSTNSLFNRLLS